MQTNKTKKVDTANALLQQLGNLSTATSELTSAVRQLKPVAGKAKGAPLEVPLELQRQLAIKAQFLGLKGADELVQVVLMAFLEMAEDDHWITFPLMLQQVETLNQ
jgi:hypothetical protein